MILMRMRGLHKDEGGQSIVFVALTLLFVVLFVFMVINTGDVTTKKMRAVSAADSVAVSGATWMARGYNTTAMINVAMSQILAIIILIRATEQTHEIARILIEVQYAIAEALKAFPYTAPIGAVLYIETKIVDVAEDAIEDIMEPLRDNLDNDGDGILWDICNALTKLETVIVKVIPFVAQIESIRIAAVNGATFGFLYPMIPLVDLELPFIDDSERKFEDLCQPTHDGKVKGQGKIEHLPTTDYMGASGVFGDILSALTFDFDGYGPAPLDYFKAFMPYPALRILPPFIGLVYDGVVEATYVTMCTDSVGTFTFDNQATSCPECRQHKDELKNITVSYTEVATRRTGVNNVTDVVDKVICDPIDMDPRCKVIDSVHNGDKVHEIYGYYEPKVVGKDKMEGSQLIELDNSSQISVMMSMLGSDCKKKEKSSFSRTYYDGLYDDKTEATKRARDKDGNVIPVTITRIEYWELKSCMWQEEREAQPGNESEEDKPKPYLLNREDDDGEEYWKNHKDYVGITYMKSEQHVLSGRYLKNPNPLGLIYFSQSEIYVPDGVQAHLFNQCWRVRLVRFDKLGEVAGGVNGGSMNNMENTTGENLGGNNGGFLGALNSLGGSLSDEFILH